MAVSESYHEVDESPCAVCGRDVHIEYRRYCSKGVWGRWIAQGAFCVAGCVVRDAEARIRHHIAR